MEIFGSVIIQLCQVIYFGLNLASSIITLVYTKNQQKTAPLKTRLIKEIMLKIIFFATITFCQISFSISSNFFQTPDSIVQIISTHLSL